MIDSFGHNGHQFERQFGVIGLAGRVVCVRRQATMLLIASYADPCIGKLHECVPIPTWPNAAANDKHFLGNLDV